MSSLGQMVAGITHEINNAINFIYANLTHINNYTQDLLNLIYRYQQRYPDSEIQKYAEEIELEYITADLAQILCSMKAGSERICNIILSLRNFSRHDEAEMKRVNIHEGIDNALLLLQYRLKPNDDAASIQIITEYGNLPLIECYPRQLNQVFMNILTNAIDALETNEQQHDKKIVIKTTRKDSEGIQIKIIDNGSGISEKVLGKLFDPFFTTKPVGKGTGLGLTVSYQILEKHQGDIKVISELGKGTEVTIELPQVILKNRLLKDDKTSV
jgi:signal transduction histidine kinase